ncbi:MAG: sulfite exporter TauE/SafE family protein [Kutzneria sp.]|nr:sulfite exporter TauE/SafE family protein [Kutzneria sp.]MBV9845016.1 sulfite exporter TauE/SafE family protein [Kutzneria sp.]
MLGIGVVGGVVGALLGGGTGTVTVPALDKLTEFPRATIYGTSSIANVAVAIVGTVGYALRGGAVDFAVGIPLMVGGALGAVLGARLVLKVPERVLRMVFIMVLLVAGGKLIIDAAGIDPIGEGAVLPAAVREGTAVMITVAALLGVLIGAWSAALGLGGGLLTVPALVLLFGAGLHVAEGTSLVVMLPNSIIGAVTHIRQRTASVPVGSRLASGAAVGAVLGVLLALAIPGRVLELIFGAFVLFMAVREIRRMRAKTG